MTRKAAARIEIAPSRPAAVFDARAVLENTSDSVCVLDRNWTWTYANHRARQDIAGGRDVLGQNLWAMFPQLEQSGIGLALRVAMSNGHPLETEGVHPVTGEWFSAEIHPLSGGLSVFFRKSRKEEIALAARERRFHAMFSTMTQGIVFHDRDGAIIEANPAAEQILGISKAEMRAVKSGALGLKLTDENGALIEREKIPAEVALRSGQTVRNTIVTFLNRTTGERRWLSVDAIPQFDSNGAVLSHAYTLFRDVTAHKQAEHALEHSQAHLALAQRVAAVGSTVIDFQSGEWEWSDETYRIFGVSKKDFCPSLEAILGLIHEKDRSVFRDAMEAASRGVVPYPIEFRVHKPNGTDRIIYHEADAIRDRFGAVTGIIATNSDITDLRAAEREREALQNQLYHAQRLDSLGTLAGGIAHDLNNTLVPILGLSEAMLKGADADSPQRPLLEVIHQAGARARDLVRQILTFSRRENPDNRVVMISGFVRESMRLARASVPTTITIEERIGDVAPIMGDASQLHQVVLNLIANAAQAIGENIGRITVEVADDHRNCTDEGKGRSSFVRISVEDTGSGMDELTQKRMFEPFYTTRKVGVGTGLGLSVVHGIVAAHGGHIEVKSRLGHGSRFDVFLPIYVSEGEATNANGDPR